MDDGPRRPTPTTVSAVRLVVTILALLTTACGSRTDLALSTDGGRAPSRRDASLPDAGPPPQCYYEPHGEPIELYTVGAHGEGVADPKMVVLEEGAETRLAFAVTHRHFWHSDIRLAEVFIGDAWPDGVRHGESMTLVGIDAHAPARLVRATTPDRLLMGWYRGDEAADRTPGVRVRPFDTAAWRPGEEQLIEEGAAYLYSLTELPGGDLLAVYRSHLMDGGSETRAVRLNPSGRPQDEPLTVVSALPGPWGAMAAWTGSAVLVASNGPEGTTVHRLDTDRRTLTLTTRIPPLAGRRPRAPTLVAHGGQAWIAWREDVPDEREMGVAMRLARLTAIGDLLNLPIEDPPALIGAPFLHISAAGALLRFAAEPDLTLTPTDPGYNRIVLRHISPDGEDLDRLEHPITHSLGQEHHFTVTASAGRRLYLSWSAIPPTGGNAIISLARYDCIVP